MKIRRVIVGLLIFLSAVCFAKPTFSLDAYPVGGKLVAIENPKTVTFTWNYRGIRYSLQKTLYKSVYDYYKANPEEAAVCADQAVLETLSNLMTIGKSNHFSEDETLEFVVAFVQQIPYDHARLKVLEKDRLAPNPRVPYAVLYDNMGVCGEKTDLAILMVRALGYGCAALYVWPEEYEKYGLCHEALLIRCAREFSSCIFSGEYSFVEITTTDRIGVMPWVKINGILGPCSAISPFSPEEKNLVDAWLRSPMIQRACDGKAYGGSAELRQISEKLRNLRAMAAEIKKQMDAMGSKDELTRQERRYALKTESSLASEQYKERCKKKHEAARAALDKYNEYSAELDLLKKRYQEMVKQLQW